MNRIFQNTQHSDRILQLTADTMLLVSAEGVCMDVSTHSSLWFLQEDYLLGKNLFDMLPENTRKEIVPDIRRVLEQNIKFTRNYNLSTSRGDYFFKCIMYPYEGMLLCQYRDITERSNVKHQLEVANHRLEEVQKAAGIAQWRYNTGEGILYYSGYTGIMATEEEQAMSFDDYVNMVVAEDRAAFRKWIHKNEEADIEESTGYRVSMGKKIFYIRIKAFLRKPEPDGSYTLEGYIQNVTDIQQQRNDISTLTHAINKANECITATRADGSMIFANNTFRRFHNIPEDADISQYKLYEVVADLQSQEDWDRRCALIDSTGSGTFTAENPVKNRPDILAFQGILHSVTDDNGEVSYWSFTHNITDTRIRESKIRQLNHLLNAIMTHLPAGIVVKDTQDDFRHIYRNAESYNRFSVLNKTTAVGKNDFELHEPVAARLIRSQDEAIVATGNDYHETVEDRDAEGNRIVLDKMKMLLQSDNSSPLILSIEWNVTELEEMKRELLVAKERAETSDKLKSAFLANMSHEIRTPLNAIVGFSRIIMECDDPTQRREYYEVVEANNERLLQLINEILDLSKIESGMIEFAIKNFLLDELCNDAYNAHVFRCPPDVQLVYEPSDPTIRIDSDKNRVFQVISNLIGNALKFTSEGAISFGYERKGDYILFHVRDTGLGIDSNKVGKVFDRFVKVNNHAQGTGLGLSICKTIVERLGGEIWVTSDLGKGTTFFFTLPAHTILERINTTAPQEQPGESPAVKAEQPTHAISKPASDITILVAEDTDSNYDLLNAIIGKKFRVIRAIDGIEAVTLFEEVKPDLILMDIKMPNLDGLEATRIIRELSTDVPIIAQSAYAYEHDQEAAFKAGCNDFISKPIMQDRLKQILSKWLPQ